MKLYYYCFYRLTTAYKFLDESTPEISAMGVVSAIQILNILSILALLKLLNLTLIYVIGISIFIINCFFIFTKKKYLVLLDRWKDEDSRYKKLKLYLIWLYFISSILVFAILC